MTHIQDSVDTHKTKVPTKKEVLAELYVPTREEMMAIESWKMDWFYSNNSIPKHIQAIYDKDEDNCYCDYDDDCEHGTQKVTKSEQKLVDVWEDKDHPGWKTLRESLKWVALQELINLLCKENNIVEPSLIVMDAGYAFYPDKNVIVGTKGKPSIISVLHEVGHNIKGDSELSATRYAIGVFAVCFPTSYAKLKWEKGQLVQ